MKFDLHNNIKFILKDEHDLNIILRIFFKISDFPRCLVDSSGGTTLPNTALYNGAYFRNTCLSVRTEIL